jgi:hypothetical protein
MPIFSNSSKFHQFLSSTHPSRFSFFNSLSLKYHFLPIISIYFIALHLNAFSHVLLTQLVFLLLFFVYHDLLLIFLFEQTNPKIQIFHCLKQILFSHVLQFLSLFYLFDISIILFLQLIDCYSFNIYLFHLIFKQVKIKVLFCPPKSSPTFLLTL